MDKRLLGCAYNPVAGRDKGCSFIPSAYGCFFMVKDSSKSHKKPAKTKEQRLAEALRANLRRRKAPARGAVKAAPDTKTP